MGWDLFMFAGLDPRASNLGMLLSLDFDDHRRARKLVQVAFTSSTIKGYRSMAERHFDDALGRWMSRGEVSFKREVRELLAGVSTEIFTGATNRERVSFLERTLTDFWGGGMAVLRNPWVSGAFRRSRCGFEMLRTTILAEVPQRRAVAGDDLFSNMCRVEGEEFDDDAIVRVFLTIMVAAFDTTSAAVTSRAYLLARHPEWQERLREEVLGAVGGPSRLVSTPSASRPNAPRTSATRHPHAVRRWRARLPGHAARQRRDARLLEYDALRVPLHAREGL